METKIGFSPEGRFKKRLTDKIHNGLMCYEIYDGEITGMAFVTSPAHESKAIVLSEQDQTIAGAILIPDKMIYRIDPLTGDEHYIYFTRDVIQLLFKKYNLAIWSDDDKIQLIKMFCQGYSIKDIATELKRPEENVNDFVEKSGDAFRNFVIVTMFDNKYSVETIAERLNITIDQLKDIVISIGGKIIEPKDEI